MKTVLLLVGSNIFMTIAWYGHLKFKWLEGKPIIVAIVLAWLVAFFEYCLQVPANRIGFDSGQFDGYQLKVIQECVTLVVFGVFVTFYFGEHLRWNHAAAGLCLIAAAFFVFHSW